RTPSSSRRTPVRRIMSSIDATCRGCARSAVQSCAQRLQKQDQNDGAVLRCSGASVLQLCGGTAVLQCGAAVRSLATHSSNDGSSHPHFGQSAGGWGGAT